MIARYYYAPLRRSLILFPVCSLAVGLVTFFSMKYNISFFISGILTTALAFLFYWSPIALSRIEQSPLTAMLPCRWSERATFVMLFALIGLPVLVYLPYYCLHWLGQYMYPDFIEEIMNQSEIDGLTFNITTDHLLSAITTAIPFVVSLYTVYATRKNRTFKSIMFSVISLIAQSIVIGVLVAASIFSNIDIENPANNNFGPGEISHDAIESIYQGINYTIGILGAVVVLFLVLTVLRFRNFQIK